MNKIKLKLKIICLLLAIVLLSLATFLTNVHSESQPPSPTPPKTIKRHNNNPEKSRNYNEKAQQISTEAAPIVDKTIQSSASQPKASENTKSTNDKSSAEWWLVYVTAILVLVTTALAIYTAMLWRATKMLAQDAKDAAARQSAEMQASLLISKESVDITKESVELARKEFVSTHRPKLIIRSVTIKPPTHPALPIEGGKPVVVEGVVVNVGNTPTEIIESNVTVLVGGPKFQARTPFGPGSNNINGIKLVPGGAYTFCLPSEQVDFKNTPDLLALNRGEKVIYFFGFLMYRDDIGNTRRTAFCRRYNPNAERFTLVNDPNYEYTD